MMLTPSVSQKSVSYFAGTIFLWFGTTDIVCWEVIFAISVGVGYLTGGSKFLQIIIWGEFCSAASFFCGSRAKFSKISCYTVFKIIQEFSFIMELFSLVNRPTFSRWSLVSRRSTDCRQKYCRPTCRLALTVTDQSTDCLSTVDRQVGWRSAGWPSVDGREYTWSKFLDAVARPPSYNETWFISFLAPLCG